MVLYSICHDLFSLYFSGSQYASRDARIWLNQRGMRQSMSGTGNCYDNAPDSGRKLYRFTFSVRTPFDLTPQPSNRFPLAQTTDRLERPHLRLPGTRISSFPLIN